MSCALMLGQNQSLTCNMTNCWVQSEQSWYECNGVSLAGLTADIRCMDCIAGRLEVHDSSYVLLYCPSNGHQVDVVAISDAQRSMCANGGDDDGEQSGNRFILG